MMVNVFLFELKKIFYLKNLSFDTIKISLINNHIFKELNFF